MACSQENKVSLRGVGRLRVPHLSNIDVLPLKRKELREYILVSPVSAPRLLLSLTRLLAYLLACHLGNSPSCTSSEFILCQALKLKKVKKIV
jgi:hypothetical protein